MFKELTSRVSRAMNILAGVEFRGDIAAWKVFEDGSREKVFEKKNLIVKAARLYLLSGLWNKDVVADPIANFKVGIGGCIDPKGLYPKTEDPTQTNLVTPILTTPTSYVVYEDEVKVTFLADVSQSEGNGQLISEAGLFKVSGLIFNVKNFPAIAKTSEFGLHFEWSIKAV